MAAGSGSVALKSNKRAKKATKATDGEKEVGADGMACPGLWLTYTHSRQW